MVGRSVWSWVRARGCDMAARTDTTLGWIRPQRGLAGAGYCAVTALLVGAGALLAMDALGGTNTSERIGARREVSAAPTTLAAGPEEAWPEVPAAGAGHEALENGVYDRSSKVRGRALLAGVRADLEEAGGSQRAVLITDGLQEGKVALAL